VRHIINKRELLLELRESLYAKVLRVAHTIQALDINTELKMV